MRQSDISQSDLSRYTGIPQGRISRYVNGHLEPSQPTLDRLLSALGVTVNVDVQPVTLSRNSRRSWLLHREIARLLGAANTVDWDMMSQNLHRVAATSQGHPHEANIKRWRQLIDTRDLTELRRVLTDTSSDGIQMREVSPMAGLLPEPARQRILTAAG